MRFNGCKITASTVTGDDMMKRYCDTTGDNEDVIEVKVKVTDVGL